MVFNEGFAEDFKINEAEYDWIYNLLQDEPSRETFRKLVSFRLKYDIDFLSGFTPRENSQYFEDFLQLRSQGETFVDVGGTTGSIACNLSGCVRDTTRYTSSNPRWTMIRPVEKT